MKSIIKVYGSYVQYNTRDFLYNLLYSSMHCVVLLLENMNSYFEVAYFSFVMYYGYIPYVTFSFCFTFTSTKLSFVTLKINNCSSEARN